MLTQAEAPSQVGSPRVRKLPVSVLVGAVVLLLATGVRDAFAEGVVRDSIGPISSGRGGVNLGYADNLSLINDNPSALARLEQFHLEVDLDFLKTDLNFEGSMGEDNAKDELFVLPSLMASWHVTKDPAPITVGLGFFMPAGFGAEFDLEHPVFGKEKYFSQCALYKLLPSVGIDLGKGFSIGGSIGPALEQAEFEAPCTFKSGPLTGLPGLMDISADGLGYCWGLGVQYRPTDRWTFGIAYVSETRINLEGDFKLDLTGVPLPVPVPDTTAKYDLEMENTFPRSLGIGGSYRFDWGTVGLDALWFDWSSAFDALTFNLSNGDNPYFNAITGPTCSDQFPLRWHDSYTIRVGSEVFLSPNDTLRAGYIYITNPVPDRTLTPLIPANLEHSFSLGYGHRFGPVSIDLAYQFSFGERQEVDESLVGPEFDDSSMLSMAHWFFLGAHMSF